MVTLKELSDLELLDTMEDLLEKRMIAAFATNTTLSALLRESQPFTWTQGKPPIGKLLDTPGAFLWIIRERPFINAQGSLLFHEYEVALRISMGNRVSMKPLKMNDDGTFKDFQDEKHTSLREAHAIRKAIRLVLETEGYDNNWYYDFVQQGVLGELNRINFNYDEIGGVGDAPNLFVQYLTVQYTVFCWSESSVQIPYGSLAVTVGDPVVVPDATVTMTDKYGNTIWDSSGNSQWTTDAWGVATITNAVAQGEVTVSATDGTQTGSTSSVNIANGATTAVEITIA